MKNEFYGKKKKRSRPLESKLYGNKPHFSAHIIVCTNPFVNIKNTLLDKIDKMIQRLFVEQIKQ